jgi:hypothetical protein
LADAESGSRVFSNEQACGRDNGCRVVDSMCPKRRRVEPISLSAVAATIPRWCRLGDELKLACVIGHGAGALERCSVGSGMSGSASIPA